MKKRGIAITTIVLLAVVLFGIAVPFLLRLSTNTLLEWMFRPTEIPFSENARNNIQYHLGIQVPSSAKYKNGYMLSGKDTTYIYIFEFSLLNDINADSYLRNILQLDSENYTKTIPIEDMTSGTFRTTLYDLGYRFTHIIEYTKRDFSEVYYRIDDDTLQIALVFGR